MALELMKDEELLATARDAMKTMDKAIILLKDRGFKVEVPDVTHMPTLGSTHRSVRNGHIRAYKEIDG